MKLIIADPIITKQSPTMRGIVAAIDSFESLFSEIEVWASECDWHHPKVTLRKVPRPFKPWPLHSQYYTFMVKKWARELDQTTQSHLLQTSGCFLHKTDIRFIQFWNDAFFEESRKRPESLRPDLKTKILGHLTAHAERKVAADPTATGEWWVVSRSLAKRISDHTVGEKVFRILPNSYDTSRFNLNTRTSLREKMRAHYGLSPKTMVLAFAAFGHFERKGLRQAAETIQILRASGHDIVLKVFGGTESAISSYRNSLLGPLDGVRFVGSVDQIETHLSAADGFFFPSHFEAFSLAEIEAAALGLRLYLTPHYGSEMILRDPINGRFIPWDPAGMARIIAEDIDFGIFGQSHAEMGEALDAASYGTQLAELYRQAISRKVSASL